MAVKPGFGRQLFQTIGSLRTGIILLILVGVVSAAGTVILQRPATSAEDMQRAYAPGTLRILDATGFTDVYHAWWYLALMAMLAISIIFVSIDRWPNAWRYYSRPYRRTDSSFRAVLPIQKSFPISDPAQALDAAERALKKQGLKPERIVEHDEVSLYAEKSRFAVLAVYVVHLSLLLIMAGGIIDGLYGYKGYLGLVAGKAATDQIELRDGKMYKLPFAVRCDSAGQENYTGEYAMMPKRWWSKLTVVEDGQEKTRKEIVVNDPLVYRGVRFYQSGYGQSAELKQAKIGVVIGDSNTPDQVLTLAENSSATLNDGSSVKLVRFISDAYQMDGGVYQRSKDLGNAAAELQLTGKDGKAQTMWLFRSERSPMNETVLVGPYDTTGNLIASVPYRLVAQMEMQPETGLQVSHEPGQWSVWAGCVLMAIGLVMAFWVLHQRYWVVPVTNKEGRLVLWVGAAANKNREGFAVRFRELSEAVEKELTSEELIATEVAAATARS